MKKSEEIDEIQQAINNLERKRDLLIAEYKRLKLPLDIRAGYDELELLKKQIAEYRERAESDAKSIVEKAGTEAENIINKAKEEADRINREARETLEKERVREAKISEKEKELKAYENKLASMQAALDALEDDLNDDIKNMNEEIDYVINSLLSFKRVIKVRGTA